MTPIQHIRFRARHWWRLNSIQIAAFWSVIGGAIIAAWPVASWFLNQALPDGPLRIAVGAAVSAVTLGSFLYARLRPQPGLPPASSSAAVGNQNAK